MRRSRLHKVILVILVSLCLSVQAQDNGWQFDSLVAKETSTKSDAQIIYELLLHMLDRWNAHDIEGYLACYWNSPELLVLVDSEQFNGWQQMHDTYTGGYPNRASMGFASPARIQVRFFTPTIALALTWWSLSFPDSKRKVVGNSTMNLQKFEDGWKVIAAHSCTAEM
jgi:ketosteroid isomerase-like protein